VPLNADEDELRDIMVAATVSARSDGTCDRHTTQGAIFAYATTNFVVVLQVQKPRLCTVVVGGRLEIRQDGLTNLQMD